MSVQVTIYGLNLAEFGSFLTKRTADVLSEYTKLAPSRSDLPFHVGAREADAYVATPGSPVFRVQRGKKGSKRTLVSLSEEPLPPFLQEPISERLREEPSFGLAQVLARFATSQAHPFIQQLSSGYQRWWMGTYLMFLRDSGLFQKSDVFEASLLFKKALGRWDCGVPLPEQTPPSSHEEHPWVPHEPDDPSVGVWDPRETTGMLDLIKKSLEALPYWSPTRVPSVSSSVDGEFLSARLSELLSIEQTIPAERMTVFVVS